MKQSIRTEIDSVLSSMNAAITGDGISSNGAVLSEAIALATYTAAASRFPAGYKKKTMRELIAEYNQKDTIIEVPQHGDRHPTIPDNYASLLNAAGISYRASNNRWYIDSHITPATMAQIRARIGQWREDAGKLWLSQRDFTPSLEGVVLAIEDADNGLLNIMRKRINDKWKYSTDFDSYRTIWINRFLNEFRITDNIEEHTVMISHFFWQIKRSLLVRPRYQNIALWVMGEGGTGKSYVIDHTIVKSIGDEFSQVFNDIQALNDVWSTASITSTPLVVFHDTADQVKDKGKLKAIVDDGRTSSRAMHTQSREKTDQVCNLIFTSNEMLSSVIKDEGMRRWWSIQSLRNENDKMDPVWLIDNFDNFMRSIDDDREQGYHNEESGYYESINQLQANESTIRDVDQWITTNLVSDGSNNISLDDVYAAYTAYETEHPVSKRNIKIRLRRAHVSVANSTPVMVKAVWTSNDDVGTGRAMLNAMANGTRPPALSPMPSLIASVPAADTVDENDITDEILNGKK